MKKKKFIFLITCFNSGKFIYKNSLRLIKKIKKLKINYNIVFINDGSIDNTYSELKKIKSKNNNIQIISHKKNLGKSSVLKLALKKCSNDIVIFYRLVRI